MEVGLSGKLKKAKAQHQAEVSRQTGFTSAATHYAELGIDLHKELVTNQDATFFIRVEGNKMEHFHVYDNDVLIVDRSLTPKSSNLALVVRDGEFAVVKVQSAMREVEYTLWGVITYIIHKAP